MKTFYSSVAIGAMLAATAATGQSINITGAGATFPYPIYSKWFDAFKQAHPGVQINYQSLGSGAGIRQLEAGTVDFGASDFPMTDEQIGKQKVKPLHFPTVMGGVVPIYNVPGKSDIKFTGAALAGIFNGTIKKWNDPVLVKDNPGLPDKPIIVVHRSDGSGTTFVFTDYLTKVSKDWTLGANASVKWPVGLGAKGSEGVTGQVKNTEYSVSYVELIFAVQNKIGYGPVQNAAGQFVKADARTVSAAAAGAAKSMPADYRVSIVNAPGKDSYPISTFTWLLIPSRISDAAKKKNLVEFLHWMLKDGQSSAAGLGYAPLPADVAKMVDKSIAQVQ